MDVIEFYRTKKETFYNLILCSIGALIWIVFAYYLINYKDISEKILPLIFMVFFYASIFGLIILISTLSFRAIAFGNMILINENQFPELNEIVEISAKKLGMKKTPEVFLYNSNGVLNAFARQIFGRKYILLTSALIDLSDAEQIKFVIGHELGHHVAGHLGTLKFLLKLPVKIIPFLSSAYSRQCEYTSDGLGYFVSGNFEKSASSIQLLGCGCNRMKGKMNLFEFEKQEELIPPVFGFLTEIIRSHPRLTRRVKALRNKKLIS